MISDQLMNPADLARQFDQLRADSSLDLAGKFAVEFEPLFSEDLLYGQSPLAKLQEWISSVFESRLQKEGERGDYVRNAIANPNLDHLPDVLKEVVTCISVWFLPQCTNVAALLSLIVIISKVYGQKSKP